jgi:hypothetical protein
MAAGAGLMAREKRAKPATKPVAPPPPAELERETIVNMKGSPEYSAWLEEIHRKTHIPKVQIVRLAIAAWAEQNGYRTPPEI